MATVLPPTNVSRGPRGVKRPLNRLLDRLRGKGAAQREELVGPIRGEVLGADRLAERARTVARQQRTLPPTPPSWLGGPGPLLRRLDDTRRVLADVQQRLSGAAERGIDISSAGEWLLDNYYIIQEHMREVRMSLPSEYYQELPKLASGKLRGYPRVYELAIELIAHTEGRLDLDNIALMMREYQRVTPLRLGELWAVPTMLRLGLIENIRRMALRTADRLKEVEMADTCAAKLRNASEESSDALARALSDFIDAPPPLTPTFVARFLSQIRNYQTNFTPLVWLEQWIAEDGPSAEEAVTRSNRRIALTQVTVTNSIMSLRMIARLDWNELVETHSVMERTLREDPAEIYAHMTFATRDQYRHVVERIAKRTERDEPEIANIVVGFAQKALAEQRDAPNNQANNQNAVQAHVGYWLIDKGREVLEQQVHYTPTVGERLYRWVLRHPNTVYFGTMSSVALLVMLCIMSVSGVASVGLGLTLLLALLIPASEVGVNTVNQLVTLFVPPRTLPKIDLEETGVLETTKTVVVVPTLFGSVASVREALEHLEVQYLANEDPHLYFAVLSDFTDAKVESAPEDGQIVDVATRGIRALNDKYRSVANGDVFFMLHRRRRWNSTQRVWMGWERKRGKLAQFNQFLRSGNAEPFPIVAGDLERLLGARYVITLDSDTVLPRGSAHTLIGTMAHPLNRAVYDAEQGRVVRGYGILQPRVGVALTSAHRSKFAAIHSGHPGVDPYTTAVSDVYQDLYGEGSFTGKGIYDVEVFEAATHGRFPENTLLSHDLIEGTYARAGLLTDVEVYDEYPTRYLAYTRRKHRWIRGDWQIIRWLSSRVPGPDGAEPNRLPMISRWKIFDNLRRSLVEISQLVLLMLGWWVLPSTPLLWTGVVLALVAYPWVFSIILALVRPPRDQSWRAYYAAVGTDALTSVQQLALAITFLPHQAAVSLDAIVRTVVRMTITHRNLLEWQTASQVERALKSGADREVYRRMWQEVIFGVVVLCLASLFAMAIIQVGLMARAVSGMTPSDDVIAMIGIFLAIVPLGVVWTISPSIAAALSAPAIPGEIRLSDSERTALLRYARLHWEFFDTFVTEETNWLAPDNFQEDPDPVVALRTSPTNIGLQLLSTVSAADLNFISRIEMIERLERIFKSLERMHRHRGHFYNWYDLRTLQVLEPAYVSTVDSGNLAAHFIALKQACVQIIYRLQPRTGELPIPGKSLAGGMVAAVSGEQLTGTLTPDDEVTDEIRRLRAIADRAFAYAQEMDFTFLFDDRRKLFSIGFHTTANTFDNSFYDLLASEARLASFIAIAKGDVPVEHWFRLGRSLTPVTRSRALISWSGSMFEYLMPLLVTQTYPFTLLDQTYHGAVRRQISYGTERRVPWGVSESAYNVRDRDQTYQYRAFGVPDLALKRGLSKDMVVAPYATMLALLIEPKQALRNLTVLEADGALGPYGFRDAVDYTRPAAGSNRAIVRTYMAHHIGMSLVALTNALERQIWQRRFHADPLVRSNELVLHERIPRRLVVQEPASEDAVVSLRTPAETARPAVREMTTPHTAQPHIAVLGNIPYTTMITNAGGGFSRYADIVVTRWRRDTTRDNQGEWIYLKDLTTGRVWSAAHQPVGVDADTYRVLFASDRVEFSRRDGDIDTQMEVIVSSDDAAEVRRITVTNRSSTPREIELTSYAEIVLQSLDADRQHPAYGNLFVQTEWVGANSAILATRRPKSSDDKTYWGAHVVATGPERIGPVMYETDRAKFIGRGKSVRHPAALEEGGTLTNTAGAPLDPIFSLRVRLRVAPGKSAQASFTTFVTETRERALELVDLYDDPFSARRALDLSWAQAHAELRDLGIAPADAALYQQLAGYLMYPHPRLGPTGAELRGSQRGQQSLWALGISGDVPILLATIESKDGLPSVRQLLQAHQYWRIKGVQCDLVILNEHPPSYLQELNDEIAATVMASSESAIIDRPGGVFIRRTDVLAPEDVALLRAMARVHVVCDGLGLGNLLEFPDGGEEYAGRPEAPVPPRYTRRIAGARVPESPLDTRTANGYGFFNEAGEYELRLSGTALPPAPWCNVVANAKGGFFVSESGSGCTWAQNSYFYRLTPWHNDPVRDPCSDCMYIRDDDTGDVWTATPAPIREMTEYIVKHAPGYSVFEHQHGDLHTRLQLAMATDDPVKISALRITNTGSTLKRLTITSYVEWVLGVSRDLTQQYVHTSFDADTKALIGQNFFDQQYANNAAVLAMSGEIQSFTGDRREFIGRNGTPARPAGLAKAMLGESVGEMVDPCGALQTSVLLEPGASHDVIVLLGAGESLDRTRDLVRRYGTVPAAMAEVERSIQAWRTRLTTIRVRTAEPLFDRIVNDWLLYQALSSRMWGRSALYQSSGAYGFRDQLQDVMAFLYTDPGLAREHIIRAAGRQFVEGDVQHWWHPQTGRGVRTRFSDDLVWLPYVVSRYLRVTNDTSILDEQTPYLSMRSLEPHEHEIYDLPQVSNETGTIYDHCVRALRKACTFGAHDLPLIGSGDWNDGFSRVGIGGKGESVWLAWFLISTLRRMQEVSAVRGDTATSEQFTQWAARYAKAVEARAWDGDWYIRAFFDDGTPLGSKNSDEAKIDAIAQSWSLISGVADPARAARAMASVDRCLVDPNARLIKLLDPPFDKTSHDPGYIKGYLPGVRENGAQYTHGALWVVLARALQKQGNRAFELFQLLNPLTHAQDREAVERYKVEPYVVAADVYTAEGHVGRGGWTWYTGSASWMYRVALEAILGFSKRGDQLQIDPAIPASWNEYIIEYRHGTSQYTITVQNPAHVEHGVKVVRVNGEIVPDSMIPLRDDGGRYEVVVQLG